MAFRSMELFKALYETKHKVTVGEYNKSEFIAEAGRAGIVIAVAAFDRYFTTRFAECVTPILRREGPSDGLIDLLGKAGLDLKGALGLLHADRPYRRIRNLIVEHFSELTTQKFRVIDDLFRTIGLSDFSVNVEKRARRKQLRKSIEKLVKRRHAIVHEGDLNSHGRLTSVDPYQVLKRLDHIKIFVESAEFLISNRMKKC